MFYNLYPGTQELNYFTVQNNIYSMFCILLIKSFVVLLAEMAMGDAVKKKVVDKVKPKRTTFSEILLGESRVMCRYHIFPYSYRLTKYKSKQIKTRNIIITFL